MLCICYWQGTTCSCWPNKIIYIYFAVLFSDKEILVIFVQNVFLKNYFFLWMGEPNYRTQLQLIKEGFIVEKKVLAGKENGDLQDRAKNGLSNELGWEWAGEQTDVAVGWVKLETWWRWAGYGEVCCAVCQCGRQRVKQTNRPAWGDPQAQGNNGSMASRCHLWYPCISPLHCSFCCSIRIVTMNNLKL